MTVNGATHGGNIEHSYERTFARHVNGGKGNNENQLQQPENEVATLHQFDVRFCKLLERLCVQNVTFSPVVERHQQASQIRLGRTFGLVEVIISSFYGRASISDFDVCCSVAGVLSLLNYWS